MEKFKHIVSINSDIRRLEIQRVFQDGRIELMTHIDIPEMNFENDREKFKEFCQSLGENLVVDSPDGRQVFKI